MSWEYFPTLGSSIVPLGGKGLCGVPPSPTECGRLCIEQCLPLFTFYPHSLQRSAKQCHGSILCCFHGKDVLTRAT